MKIDLLHNRIVCDTMTDRFREEFCAHIEGIVTERYPTAHTIRMYEDYIADKLLASGRWHYPLTVIDTDGAHTLWVSWPFFKVGFASASPYSYVGEGEMDITVVDELPEGFADILVGRAITYDDSSIKLVVRAASDDPFILVGSYSQTFVDEMARQVTERLMRAMAIRGLADSSIELELVFAPGTYMEHTSENVTYRRLLLVDGVSAPRDFWVKWTRVGASLAYTISDNVSPDGIVFELGEDVAQKIREKEYRFLCSANPNKYRSAMGKRTVTEWRDVVKRAIRRGELVKVASDLEVAQRDTEVNESLARVLGIEDAPVSTPTETGGGFDDITDMLRRVLVDTAPVTDDTAQDEPVFGLDLPDTPVFIADAPVMVEPVMDEPVLEVPVLEKPVIDAPEVDEPVIDEDIDAPVWDAPDASAPALDTPDEDVTEDESLFDIPEANDTEDEPLLDTPDEDNIEDDTEDVEEEIIDKPVVLVKPVAEPVTEPPAEQEIEESDAKPATLSPALEHLEEIERLREARMRDEIIATARLDAEVRARESLEAERELLRQERERLLRENERLAALAREAEDRHRRAIEEHRLESERSRQTADMLRREIDARDRQEARERDRIAEAARLSIEEQRRIEREDREREALEAERLERERIAREREEERARLEEERARIERERRAYTPPVAPAPTPVTPAPQSADYMSKRVKIIFRQPVEFSIINRIKAVIEQTLVSTGKSDVPIHMKAYPEDNDIITIHITKMPRAEYDLLISIVKAIGNAKIGVTKILLE